MANSVKVTVSFYGYIRDAVVTDSVTLTMPSDVTLRGLFKELSQKLGDAFVDRVMLPDGRLHNDVTVFLGGASVDPTELDRGLVSRPSARTVKVTVAVLPAILGA